MKVTFLIGSGLRRGAVRAALDAGFDIAGVLTPWSQRFDGLRDVLRAEHPELTVRRVRKDDVGAALEALGAGIGLCIGWPTLFPPALLVRHTLLNAHPTLLPRYRGPNPWYHIIANGDREAGCTVHLIDEGMDTGPILHQRAIPLTPFDTYRSLRHQLVELEPQVVVEALTTLRDGTASYTPQDESQASLYLDKRGPDDSELDASRPLADLLDAIRACDPDSFPAFIMHGGQKVCLRLWRPDRPAADHPESL